MTSPTVVTNAMTAEFHTCITGLLQHWQSSHCTSVEFSVPGLWYSSEPSQSSEKNTVFHITAPLGPQCYIHLKPGETRAFDIHHWLRGEWIAEIEFGTITEGGFNSFKKHVWDSGDRPHSFAWPFGAPSLVSKLLSNAAIPDELHIRMRFRRVTPLTTKDPCSLTRDLVDLGSSVRRLESTLGSFKRPSIESEGTASRPIKAPEYLTQELENLRTNVDSLDSTLSFLSRSSIERTASLGAKGPHSFPQELENLKKSLDRLEPTLRFFNRPSIDITRVIFNSRDGRFKYLYIPSQLLLKYDYFRAFHTPGFRESGVQPMETSELTKTENLPVNKDSYSDGDSDSYKDEDGDEYEDKDEEEVEDSDSDFEWELENEKDYTHSVDLKFKVTLYFKDVSRRTFKAFVEWALCGALHFAPCRADYRGYVKSCEKSMVGEVMKWPAWANIHCTVINNFGNLKTLTSPRSLYRLADKLLIPDLKAQCRQQIIENFKMTSIIQEINKIQDHPDLLKDAYEYVKNNWNLVVQQENFFSIISNCPQSAQKVFHGTILTKLSPNK